MLIFIDDLSNRFEEEYLPIYKVFPKIMKLENELST